MKIVDWVQYPIWIFLINFLINIKKIFNIEINLLNIIIKNINEIMENKLPEKMFLNVKDVITGALKYNTKDHDRAIYIVER